MIFGATLFLVSTVKGAAQDQERWDRKYESPDYLFGKEPIPFLKESLPLLPRGQALDIAMGEGRNGVFLAMHGFEVTGLDISPIGLKKAEAFAKEAGVRITTKVVDLESYALPVNAYDVIVCSYYLQRDLFPRMVAALKAGGMVIVETYTQEHKKYQARFPDRFLLRPNELLEQFKDLTILRYQVVDDGKAVYASILAQKR